MIKLPDHTLAEFLTNESIEWNFIPPRSPNHGGLWEAGVKAFKFHLKRVVGNAHLTLEEFITILREIEVVLNSRPLTPLTSNFDDFETLTPGHFLVGTLVLIKDENLPSTKWSTGRITEIFPGTDAQFHVVIAHAHPSRKETWRQKSSEPIRIRLHGAALTKIPAEECTRSAMMTKFAPIVGAGNQHYLVDAVGFPSYPRHAQLERDMVIRLSKEVFDLL
ncbi:uncharacterized protein TNCV_309611 [Trichonephila clavipes]|nr:uncharacterized protein TNCV_309611 [Trichonephila clavipes]